MTRDHTYHPLRVARVVAETADSCSFVFDVPEELRSTFTYEPGQFCDVRVQVDGEPLIRCYSMSSSAAIGEPLQVTVKRVADGIVSNWMIDQISEDDFVEVAAPAGFFQLAGESDLVAFGAGSGITPIFSLLKTALARTSRHIRLLYANRDRDSVIFGAAIDALAEEHGDRFEVTHRLDVEHGFVDAEVVRSVIADARDPEFYICGPAPFMDIVEQTLLADGVDAGRIHIERFTPLDPPAAPATETASATANGTRVTIELDGRTDVADHRPGTTILQTARQLGMSPPLSCESGSCATCMARIVEGSASMHVNNALTPDEVEEGWVLTCQAVPTAPMVHVVYGYD
jgi:3-ketosteroid 9alpha-monooxygenase subunit B